MLCISIFVGEKEKKILTIVFLQPRELILQVDHPQFLCDLRFIGSFDLICRRLHEPFLLAFVKFKSFPSESMRPLSLSELVQLCSCMLVSPLVHAMPKI